MISFLFSSLLCTYLVQRSIADVSPFSCSNASHPQIYLGYLGVESAIKMVKHYFMLDEDLSPEQKEGLRSVFARHKKITPAVFEQFCSEHDEVDDFVEASQTHFDGGAF